MMLKKLELHGFKSFAKKSEFLFDVPTTAIVGPNGSGKSNVVESIRFVLGEQSIKSLRSASGKDLIFAGSKQIPKMNRASVTIVFDNSKRVFQLSNSQNETVNLDFDEITLSREVFADGSNTYKINDHEVRMKDIVELIASVNIGSSGHHIISQGEADRLLNANAKERKGMIEDALGLKLYQYRIRESEKKLEKTQTNLKETESLRRELAPHIKFLKRQVEKIERAKKMQIELKDMYLEYFAKEDVLLTKETDDYSDKKGILQGKVTRLDKELEVIRKELDIKEKSHEELEIEKLENEIQKIRSTKEDLARQLGRLEGMIEIAEESAAPVTQGEQKVIHVSFDDIRELVKDIDTQITRVFNDDDIASVRNQLGIIRSTLQEFLITREDGEDSQTSHSNIPDTSKIEEMRKTYNALKQELAGIEEQENTMLGNIGKFRAAIAESKKDVQQREREFFTLSTERSELVSQLNVLEIKSETLKKAQQDFKEELREAKALVGEEAIEYQSFFEQMDSEKGAGESITRESQEVTRKNIERIKIKIEEIGGGGGADVMKEYDETLERDQFLEREVTDLHQSISSLQNVISDLKEKLEKEFITGIEKINTQFQDFFAAMFGGGKATLKIITIEKRKRRMTDEEGNLVDFSEDDESEENEKEKGIEIKVNLPRKKITHLEMLSGGERSLTSIALLFALSQVNPPPFLVLDETDAALDEANSQRYGDMIENLSKLSQLIVVTHNRETMSRAQVLYGVTLGSEGCSKLLSVKFDEAQSFAK